MLRFGDNSDVSILRKISDTTKSYFEKNVIDNIVKSSVDYNLVITGTVGSGKTTMLESISALFEKFSKPTINFPEYLHTMNGELSGELLKKKLESDISSLTFQSYILDMWEKTLYHNYKEEGIKLYERCVDDSVICFCNLDHYNERLTLMEFISLFDKMKKTIENYPNIPSYFHDTNFIKIKSKSLNENLMEIIDIISSDIASGIKHRIVGIEVTDNQSFERIKDRNRDGENSYDIQSIMLFNDHYNKLFTFLSENKNIKSIMDLRQFL